jgi:HD superfamily phosphohydrolase
MASDMFGNLVKTPENLSKLHLGTGFVDRTKKILRLAALLHDVGHAPFSHAGENTMALLPEEHPDYELDTINPKKYEHEHYSKAAIKYLFNQIIEEHPLGSAAGIRTDEVLLLLGDNTVKRQQRNLVILKELITGQIDADRADYLLRDSLHLGVNYGIYDRNRFVNCVTLGELESGSVVLAIEKGGWHIAESLVIARYQMFSQVYFHKVRRIFDYHVSGALSEVLKSSGLPDGIFLPPTSEENLKKYFEWDDWKVQGEIKNGNGGEHGRHILMRTPYKRICEWDGVITEEIESEIQNHKTKYNGKRFFVDKSVSTKWYKLDKDIIINDNATGRAYPLSKISQLINAIGQPAVTRFYVSRKDMEELNNEA